MTARRASLSPFLSPSSAGAAAPLPAQWLPPAEDARHHDIAVGHHADNGRGVVDARSGARGRQCLGSGGACTLGCCAGALLLLAGLLLASAVAMPRLLDAELTARVRASIAIDSPSSPAFGDFLSNAHSDDVVLLRVFVNDIVNAQEVMLGAPPCLVSTGPFVYKVLMDRANVTWT